MRILQLVQPRILGLMIVGLLVSLSPKAFASEVAASKQLPWKSEAYTLVARQMSIRAALESFSVAQGVPILMSDRVTGVLSGDFKDISPDEFLNRISSVNNLTWYYDGTAIYVYTVSEMASTLIDLRYMKADEVLKMMVELGVEDERFPLKTASDGELIMVSGPPRYVMLVSEMIARADKLREQRTFTSVETRIYPLKHTWADNVSFNVSGPDSATTIYGVAHLLQEMMASNSGTATVKDVASASESESASEDRLTTITDAAFQPIIRADNRLNAVIVRDTVTRLPMYEKLIAALDVPQKLVEIGVTVVELTQKDALDWQLSLKAAGANHQVEGAIGQNAANLFNADTLGGTGLAGALTYLGDEVTVSASLTALREKGKARAISRTSLLTMNNMAAEMSDTQSYHARVVGTEVASLEEVSVGTKLQIKPRIVDMCVNDTHDQVWLALELQDGGFESVSIDAMPMTRTSTLETQAAVYEGHSIMLAGYMRDVKESASWGIPYLRDIPIIGWLFGGVGYQDETLQRMFILTPYIIDVTATTADVVTEQAERQRDIEAERLLDEAFDKDQVERKEREAQVEFRRELHQDHAEDRHERNEAIRDFEREKHQDQMEAHREAWDRAFEAQQKQYDEVKAKKEADVD